VSGHLLAEENGKLLSSARRSRTASYDAGRRRIHRISLSLLLSMMVEEPISRRKLISSLLERAVIKSAQLDYFFDIAERYDLLPEI